MRTTGRTSPRNCPTRRRKRRKGTRHVTGTPRRAPRRTPRLTRQPVTGCPVRSTAETRRATRRPPRLTWEPVTPRLTSTPTSYGSTCSSPRTATSSWRRRSSAQTSSAACATGCASTHTRAPSRARGRGSRALPLSGAQAAGFGRFVAPYVEERDRPRRVIEPDESVGDVAVPTSSFGRHGPRRMVSLVVGRHDPVRAILHTPTVVTRADFVGDELFRVAVPGHLSKMGCPAQLCVPPAGARLPLSVVRAQADGARPVGALL